MLKSVMAICLLVSILFIGAAHADSGLVAYFPFEGNANDATGNGYDGTVYGATSTSSGHTGKAYSFDGTNDYIGIPLNISPSAYSAFTMGAWAMANVAAVPPVRQVISQDNGGYDRSLCIDFRGGGTGWSAFSGSGAVLGYQGVTFNQWTFIAAIYDQAASRVSLYVDGNLYSTTESLGSGWASARIGSNPTFGEYFSGTIDDVFFYDRALSGSDLDTIRKNGVGGVAPEPVSSALFLMGGIALAGRHLRRKARKV